MQDDTVASAAKGMSLADFQSKLTSGWGRGHVPELWFTEFGKSDTLCVSFF